MAINPYTCSPCDGPECAEAHWRDELLYRRGVLSLLCDITAGMPGSGDLAALATETTLLSTKGVSDAILAKLNTSIDVNATIGPITIPAGAATALNQLTEISRLTSILADTGSIDGKIVVCDTGNVTVIASALPAGAATEATLATLATEATVATLATEATVATLATEATVATLATEATVATLATEATVATLATEATVATLATEATVATLATEATLLTLATEATLASIDGKITACDTGNVTVVSSVLPAGAATSANQTTAIGHLATIAGDTTSIDGKITTCDTDDVTVTSSVLPTGASTSANQSTIITALQIMDDWDNAASDGCSVSGDTAHDAVDAGEPVKIGFKTAAHGTTPTAVAAGDRTNAYANREGLPWVIGGAPNVITREYYTTAVQTNDAIIDSIGAGTKVVVTAIDATCDNANTVDVKVRIGFGAASVPAEPASGASVVGVVLAHSGIAPGSGIVRGNGSGIIGIGGDGEELRITNEVPTGGSLKVVVSYYTTAS